MKLFDTGGRHCQVALRPIIVEFVAAILVTVLFVSSLASSPRSDLEVRHPDLETRVSAFLRWANFWKHEHRFKSYSPGKQVSVKAFYSTRQVLVCLIEIEAWMSFAVGAHGRLVAMNNGLFYRSTPEEVAKRLLKPQPEVRVKGSGQTTVTDYWPPETDVLKEYRVETLTLRLPELTPPDSLLARKPPEELKSLEGIVRSAMIKWLCPDGVNTPDAIIPFFDVNDPYIYIAVDGTGFQRGYFLFEWRAGKWTSEI